MTWSHKVIAPLAALASVGAATGNPAANGFPKDWRPDVQNWGTPPPCIDSAVHSLDGQAIGKASKAKISSDDLQSAIKADVIQQRIADIQSIALGTPDLNRVFGSLGHNFTALYIYKLLTSSGLNDFYDVQYQPFRTTYVNGTASLKVSKKDHDADYISFSPAGHVQANFKNVSNYGCQPGDYLPEVKGNIAIVSRGECEFGLKSALAGAAGASALVIYNNQDGPLERATLRFPEWPDQVGHYVPTIGVSSATGKDILGQFKKDTSVEGEVTVVDLTTNRTTFNVIAQSKSGDQKNVVVVGAPADSVAAGPGINENASGVAAALETAIQLAKYKLTNAVRFIFWSSEEYRFFGDDGGAANYRLSLSPEDLTELRVYLNYDTIASPNYKLTYYNGTLLGTDAGPSGSEEVAELYKKYFDDKGIKSQPIALDWGDFEGFLDVSVPTGGLYTGGERHKTAVEVTLFGGSADAPYDPNIHTARDTVENLGDGGKKAFLINAKGVAHAVATYADSFKSLPPRSYTGAHPPPPNRRRDVSHGGSPNHHKAGKGRLDM